MTLLSTECSSGGIAEMSEQMSDKPKPEMSWETQFHHQYQYLYIFTIKQTEMHAVSSYTLERLYTAP